MTLTDFLLARIAEDETEARLQWHDGGWPAPHWRRARLRSYKVLAECKAKRRRVARWSDEWTEWHGFGSGLVRTRMTDHQYAMVLAAEWVLGNLALPYADHPDYRQEWKP